MICLVLRSGTSSRRATAFSSTSGSMLRGLPRSFRALGLRASEPPFR